MFELSFPQAAFAGPVSWEQQQTKLAEWVNRLPKPVGVMTSTDLLGQQFLEACSRANVVVPEQVAVVGADNDELICAVANPPLSSVIINDPQRGYEAAALLDKLMSGVRLTTNTVYVEPAGVVRRASTDILAIADEAVVTALRYIRDHACEGIDVNEVVDRVPMSRSMLERRFRKFVGRSLNNEIVRVRLNRAVELLCATELEIKDIAHRAGFNSASYMGAVFAEKLGRTPGSYRDASRRPTGQLEQDSVPETLLE
jgi:LacI family transcriptional regulator